MAEQAETLLAGSGWLPEPLRTPGRDVPNAVESDAIDLRKPAPTRRAQKRRRTAAKRPWWKTRKWPRMNRSRSKPTRPRPNNEGANRTARGPPAMAGPFSFSEDTMPDNASDLARRLGRQAEAVCRHYLSNGRREGRYWLVGDARNTPGRSMFVRLKGAEPARAPRANGPMPPRANMAICSTSSARAAAWSTSRTSPTRRDLSQPSASRAGAADPSGSTAPAPTGSPEAARRLFAMSQPIPGTLVETYLRQSRHHGFARNRIAALPSPLLLPAATSISRPRPGRR